MNEELIRKAVAATTTVSFEDGQGWVRTQCLYPSNSTVIVRVSSGKFSFNVSDGGGALREATSSGVPMTEASRAIARIAAQQGLSFSSSEIISPTVSSEELPCAIMLVANASQEGSHWLLNHIKVRVPRNFRTELAALLARSGPRF